MVGTSVTRNIITLNLAMLLRGAPKPTTCQVLVANVKLRIRTTEEDFFFYPDLMLACHKDDQNPYYREQPCLVIEVLSTSTERRDRADKFFAYRKLASLREYVLVAQDTERVEIYRRDTQWDMEIYGQGDSFELNCMGAVFKVAAAYLGAEPRSAP